MGFIREYAAQSGDPFSLRVPKRLRKMKLGRAIGGFLKKAVPIAAGFIPGLGGVAANLISRVRRQIPAPIYNTLLDQGYDPEEIATSFARSYGLDMGDPGAPRPAKKRKSAGAGPKAKAEKKRAKRSERAARGPAHGTSARGGKKPIDWSAIGGGLHDVIGGAADAGLLPGMAKDYGKNPFGMMGGGRRSHRRTNPANVKALRRSIRRLEGFEKLVKSVQKAYPRIRHATTHHAAPFHKRKRAA